MPIIRKCSIQDVCIHDRGNAVRNLQDKTALSAYDSSVFLRSIQLEAGNTLRSESDRTAPSGVGDHSDALFIGGGAKPVDRDEGNPDEATCVADQQHSGKDGNAAT